MHHFQRKIIAIFYGFDNWPKWIFESACQRLVQMKLKIIEMLLLLVEPDMPGAIDLYANIKAHAANYEKTPFQTIFNQIRL